MELDTGAELDATECAEVAGAELISVTNLDSGRDRWMEHSRDGRREYERGCAARARAARSRVAT